MNKVLYILKITGIVLLITVLAGYAVFAGVMAKKWHKDMICTEIKINVLDYDKYNFICEDDILTFIKRKGLYPIGKKIDSRTLDVIEKHVSRINVVRNAECYMADGKTIVIDVSQKIPMYRVVSTGKSYYVDSDRHTLKANSTFAAMLPLVTGYITENQACGKVYDFVMYLHNDKFWGNHIGQINFTKNGDIELITKIGVEKIILNSLDTYKDKLDDAKLWYDQYQNFAWSNVYSQLDLRYNNLIYCKKSNKH